jgi:predicted transcriptional regulator
MPRSGFRAVHLGIPAAEGTLLDFASILMTSWFARIADSQSDPKRFGPLEWRVLEALWRRTDAASVRDLQPGFPDIAYTTLMTTLDRLFRKGALARIKQGRAFFYQTKFTRPELESARAASALRVAIEGKDAAITPLMSFFVTAVGDRDHELLDELEAMVRARRAELEGKRP